MPCGLVIKKINKATSISTYCKKLNDVGLPGFLEYQNSRRRSDLARLTQVSHRSSLLHSHASAQ